MHQKGGENLVDIWEFQIQLHSSILPLNSHGARLGDQELINRNILTTLFSMSTILDSSKRRFSR